MLNYHKVLKNNSSWAAKFLEITIMILAARVLASCVKQHQLSLTPKWARILKMHISTHRQPNTCAHTRARAHTHKHKHTHRAFVLFPQLSSAGGRRGLATGAGQKNSGLFTFSLQPSLFGLFSPLPSVFLYSLHPTQLSVLLRGCRLWNERPET